MEDLQNTSESTAAVGALETAAAPGPAAPTLEAIVNDLAILAGRLQALEENVSEMVIPTEAFIVETVDRRISTAISELRAQLAQARAMIISPAEIEDFIDRKIKHAAPIAIAPPAAPVPAQPGADQPGPTHAVSAGAVGSTGSHGEIGANKA